MISPQADILLGIFGEYYFQIIFTSMSRFLISLILRVMILLTHDVKYVSSWRKSHVLRMKCPWKYARREIWKMSFVFHFIFLWCFDEFIDVQWLVKNYDWFGSLSFIRGENVSQTAIPFGCRLTFWSFGISFFCATTHREVSKKKAKYKN